MHNLNQKPYIVWLTGLNASGKSTLANALEVKLPEITIQNRDLNESLDKILNYIKGKIDE